MRRTVGDWIADARAASAPAEVERCLDAAAREAKSFHDWLTLLRALADTPLGSLDRLAQAAEKTYALALADPQVWGFLDVARIRAHELGDPGGARAALDAGARAFVDDGSQVYELELLARGYLEVLGDAAGARRCLEMGAGLARAQGDPTGPCDVAGGLAKLGDVAAARALLREAESLDKEYDDIWSIANGWHALGDEDEVARVVGAALARAKTTEAAIQIAKIWSSHRHTERARRAADRAAKLAASFEDWLCVAEESFALRLGRDLLERALAKAETLAADEEAKSRLANAYVLWLGDVAAADRLGPRGVRPEGHRVRRRALEGFAASASALFDWARERITPEALARIAGADYGVDAERHLAALENICKTGLLPRRLDWHPHEVIALHRWSSGDRTDHVARILCCAILTIADEDEGLDSTGPLLVESALALGEEALARTEGLLAWRCETDAPRTIMGADDADEKDEDPDDGAEPEALALLAIVCVAQDQRDERVAKIVDRLVHHPWCTKERFAELRASSVKADLWSDLADGVLVPAAAEPAVAALLVYLGA